MVLGKICRQVSWEAKRFALLMVLTLIWGPVLVGCEISPWAGSGQARSTVPEGRDGDGAERVKDERTVSETGREDAVRKEGEEESTGPEGDMGMRGGEDEQEEEEDGLDDGLFSMGVKIASKVDTGETGEGIPWIGGRNAKVRIEVFSDFACPFCRVGAQVMHHLLEKYGRKIKVLYYQTPIPSLYTDSFLASQAALAAQAQGKFWPMHDLLYDNPRAHGREDLIRYAKRLRLDVKKFEQELKKGKYAKRVRREMAVGAERGIEGTPTFFVNGRKIEGAAPLETFQKLIDGIL